MDLQDRQTITQHLRDLGQDKTGNAVGLVNQERRPQPIGRFYPQIQPERIRGHGVIP